MATDKGKCQCQGAGTCGYIYDPGRGDKRGKVPPGTDFQDLPADWKCPGCGAGKEKFQPLEEPGPPERNGVHPSG